MSSFENRRSVLGLLAAAPLLVAGCGFRSALTDQPGVGGTESTLTLVRAVYVHQPSYDARDEHALRMAQDLRNALVDRLGDPSRPAFSLETELYRVVRGAGITSTDRVTRATVEGRLTFRLFALNQEGKAPRREIYRGQEVAWAAYDRMDSPFSDRMAERDMSAQVARQLADQVFNRVAGWFNRASDGALPEA